MADTNFSSGTVVSSDWLNDVNDTVYGLPSTAAGKGAALVGAGPELNYVAGTIGAFVQDDYLNVMWWMTEAERQDVKTGAGTIAVDPKLDAATAWAASLKKSLIMPNGMYKRTTTWVVPPKVGIRAESRGQPAAIYDPANTYGHGVVLFKAHTGDGITRTGSVSYDGAAPIYGVAISSHRTTYPGGNGFVFDKVSGANLYECEVWGVAGDAIVMGVTAGDVTGQNVIFDCYVNNCGGKAYNLRAKWTRGWGNKSDGCTHHLYMNNAPETHWEAWHGEGWTSMGVQMAGANTSSRLTGKGFCSNTSNAGTYGVKIDDVAGNGDVTIEGVKILGSSTVGAVTFTGALAAATNGTLTAPFAGVTGSYALLFSDGSKRTATLTNGGTSVSWTGAVTATANVGVMSNAAFVGIDVGSQALGTRITKCEFNQCPVGVNDNNSVATRVIDNHFYQCGVCIAAASSSTRYLENNFEATVGIDIDHVVGNSGIWSLNAFSKGIKPSLTGVAGNFGTNLVKDNKGIRTRSGGTTTVGIPSGTSIAHGLSGGATPIRFVGAPIHPATFTNFRLGVADGTNIQFLWDGGASMQIQWEAMAICEAQT